MRLRSGYTSSVRVASAFGWRPGYRWSALWGPRPRQPDRGPLRPVRVEAVRIPTTRAAIARALAWSASEGVATQRVRLAARAHIPVRTSLSRHIHVPLPGHTRCIASCFEGAASWGATSECLARAQPVGQGSRERRGCLQPDAAQRSAVADQPFRLRSHGHSSRPLRHADRSPAPHISRRTPCSGYPAASTDMDVRPRGDPDTRITAAPSGAVAVARMLLLLSLAASASAVAVAVTATAAVPAHKPQHWLPAHRGA